MEAMRNRIESDPYEAVFGKRFESFWARLARKLSGEGSEKPSTTQTDKPSGIHRAFERRIAQLQQQHDEARKFMKHERDDDASKQPQSHADASSTSLDPKTDKDKKSGIKNFEYDPVSGRMVPVEGHEAKILTHQQKGPPNRVTQDPINDEASRKEEPVSDKSDNVEIPVMPFKGEVKPVIEPKFKSQKTAAQEASEPAQQQAELDELTAGDVRAAMGKTRSHSFDPTDVSEQWKSEQEALRQQIRDWDDSVTRQRNKVTEIVDEVSAVELGRHLSKGLKHLKYGPILEARTSPPQPWTQRVQSKVEPETSPGRHADHVPINSQPSPLQPSIQRMQSKAEPEPIDPDDSAAHESTEPIPTSTVPKSWSEQADILQSDRVKRATLQQPLPRKQWLDNINSRKAVYEKRRSLAESEKAAVDATERQAVDATKTEDLVKANEALQAEVDAQKVAMTEQQDRSSQKIKSLRADLDTAYKQSSVHADKFRDRIASLEQELSLTKNTANEVNVKAIKERYSDKVRHLQKELMTAYKQSSVHADEFTHRIKTLEKELAKLIEAAATSPSAQSAAKESEMKASQGEGDFSPLVKNYANSNMWYKKPVHPVRPVSNEGLDKIGHDPSPKGLTAEAKALKQEGWQIIDSHGLSGDALVEALAKYDKAAVYDFKEDGLEAELAGEVDELLKDPPPRDPVSYQYKDDGLEAQLKEPEKIADESKSEQNDYDYKPDALKSELKQRTQPESTGKNERYVYKADDLESELLESQEPDLSKPHEQGSIIEPWVQRVDSVSEWEKKAFEFDNLEAELKERSSQQHEYESDKYEAEAAKFSATPEKVSNMEKTMASSLGSELQTPMQSSPSVEPPANRLQKQQPPDGKMIRYNSASGDFTTIRVEVVDETDGKMAPLAIYDSLKRLDHPNQWMALLLKQQKKGYKVVSAGADTVVVKKFQNPSKAEKNPSPYSEFKPHTKQPKPARPVNPVDGTSGPGATFRPVTGDYANPTGFVNLDLAQDLASKRHANATATTTTKPTDNPTPSAHADEGDLNATYQDFPRASAGVIKREEPVFSGTQRVQHSNSSRRARREERQRQEKEQAKAEASASGRKADSSSSKRWIWPFLGIGVVSGAMYGVGTVAERARGVRLEREREASSRAEERGGKGVQRRWRLDEGVWRGR